MIDVRKVTELKEAAIAKAKKNPGAFTAPEFDLCSEFTACRFCEKVVAVSVSLLLNRAG